MKYSLFLIIGLFLCLGGCQSKQPEPSPQPKAVDENAEQNAKLKEYFEVDKGHVERNKAQFEKLKNKGEMLPPRDSIEFTVVKNEGISLDDANHSYLFVEAGIKRCYRQALSFEPELAGKITMTLKHAAGSDNSLADFQSDMKNDEFEKCVKKVGTIWRLPEGSELAFDLKFTSAPPPSLEEIKAMNKHNHEHDHGHDHDDEGLEQGDHDHAPMPEAGMKPENPAE